MKPQWSIKATSSPRRVGIWLQSIMLANPGIPFVIIRNESDIIIGVHDDD